MKYDDVKPGKCTNTCMKHFLLACCDCGLVHKMQFRLIPHGRGHRIETRVWRDERATAAMRRGMKRKKEGVFA